MIYRRLFPYFGKLPVADIVWGEVIRPNYVEPFGGCVGAVTQAGRVGISKC